jgi:hypothetical protein
MSIPFSMGNDFFQSIFTGKRYYWKPTPDGSDRKAAHRQLEVDDKPIIDAMAQRLNRPPTYREMIHGVDIPDNRPIRQQYEEDSKPVGQTPRDPNVNPFAKRIAEIAAQPAYDPGERGRKARRLKAVEDASAEWVLRHNAEIENEKKQLTLDSEKQLARERFAVDVMPSLLLNQGEVEQHRAILANFEKTGDVENYKACVKQWKANVSERQEAEKLESKKYIEAIENMPASLRPELPTNELPTKEEAQQ